MVALTTLPPVAANHTTNTQVALSDHPDHHNALAVALNDARSAVGAHLADTDNPHGVTAAQIGALAVAGGARDGTTDDTLAVQAAVATGMALLPPGTYLTTLTASQIGGPLKGWGQVKDSGGNKRAPWFSYVGSAPARGDWSGGITTAFNGDNSHVQLPIEHRVTGTATLGQPATGYQDNQEAAPVSIYLFNNSGWNQATGTADGRTGLAAIYSRVYQAGQGDLACYNANGFVIGALAGATSFLANPAAVLYNGQAIAGAAGVYLNPFELDLVDDGFDAAGIGAVWNFTRTNSAGALDAVWNGLRLQNKGSQPLDVGLMLHNDGSGAGFRVGLDLASADLATSGTWVQAAATLAADQRIYLNATGTDVGASIYRRPPATGTEYLAYNATDGAIEAVLGGNSSLQVAATLADTETALLVRRNVGGTYSLQRVSMGAADSAGSGFKVLRVPN